VDVEVTYVFREANERIAESARALGFTGAIPLLCECEDSACFALIRLPADDYAKRRLGAEAITIPEHSRQRPDSARRPEGDG
jgi:hypothetical protein